MFWRHKGGCGLDQPGFSTKVDPLGAKGAIRPGAGFAYGRLKQKGDWLMGIIVWLIVGAIAGWLAGLIVKGAGFGLLGNIIIGIIGAAVAGWLLPQLGVNLGTGIV